MPLSYRVENVSKGKKALLSDTSRWSTDSDAFDIFSDVDRNFSFHTSANHFPYLEIDLEKIYRLEEINLFNRRDGFQFNSRSITIEASDDALTWIVLHSGVSYWKECLTVHCGGMIRARFLRFRLSEKIHFHLRYIEVNARVYDNFDSPVCVGNRSDGLGERLNSIVNALWLSELLQADFRFTWSKKLLDNSFHAIVEVDRMFSRDFISRYLVDEADVKNAWQLGARKYSLAELEWRMVSVGGISGPRTYLHDNVTSIPEHLKVKGPVDAFNRIDFSPEIKAAINMAQDIFLPQGAIAAHIRGGDVYYTDYRKYLNYTYKGITLPIAKAMIEHFSTKGIPVFLFGEGNDTLEYLATTCGAKNSASLIGSRYSELGRHQKAMFDLVLLSRFNKIIAGSSGFSRQAAMIGGGELISPSSLFSAEEQFSISMSDLEHNEGYYDRHQAAFSYWYAYFCGRTGRGPMENERALLKAIHFDPENELYPIVLSCVIAKSGDMGKAEHVIEKLFAERVGSGELGEIFRVFTAMTLDKFNLSEYFETIAQCALQGSFFHAALMIELCKKTKKELTPFQTVFEEIYSRRQQELTVRVVADYIRERLKNLRVSA